MKNNRIYPPWFIEELVNEEDTGKAKSRILNSNDRVLFRCEKVHWYEQSVISHIELSTDKKKNRCSISLSLRYKGEIRLETHVTSLRYKTYHERLKNSNNKLFLADVVITKKNVRSEYCMSYYHTSENVYRNLNQKYHFTKYCECKRETFYS